MSTQRNITHWKSKNKNNDIMKFAGKWMELESIILGEVTQTQKDKHGMYTFINGCQM